MGSTHVATRLAGQASIYPRRQSPSWYNSLCNTGDARFGPVTDVCLTVCQIHRRAERWKQRTRWEQHIWVTACSHRAREHPGDECGRERAEKQGWQLSPSPLAKNQGTPSWDSSADVNGVYKSTFSLRAAPSKRDCKSLRIRQETTHRKHSQAPLLSAETSLDSRVLEMSRLILP